MQDLTLPMELPQPCPICGSKVHLLGVTAWETDTGKILEPEYECETEPDDIDSEEWDDWHRWHYDMPYVYWLPWSLKMIEWLNENYRYRGKLAESNNG